MCRLLTSLYFVSGVTCSLLVTHSAPASLDTIIDVPGLAPASILDELGAFRIVQIPELRPLHKQELQMPEPSAPKIQEPPAAAPPLRRTVPTPRRTLPERSVELRRLPQTEIPKAEPPTQRQRILGPPGS